MDIKTLAPDETVEKTAATLKNPGLNTLDFKTLASSQSIEKTLVALKEHNFESVQVNSKEEALAKIEELIPEGVSVMNGGSETLREIGYLELLKSGKHKWNNLHDVILAETDQAKQALLRRQAALSDFYVGSAHSITETGEIVAASNGGNQLAQLVYTSQNIVLVVGAQKITPTLTEAFRRIEEYVVPLEDVRLRGVYGIGTTHAKTLVLHKENPMLGRKVHVIIVNESLGF